MESHLNDDLIIDANTKSLGVIYMSTLTTQPHQRED
jgi:hypothetical protein